MSPLRFPNSRRQPQQGRRRQAFGRSTGGGLKVRLLIALGIAAFAFISYYSKQKDVNEITGVEERVAMTDEAQEIQLGLQAAPQMISQHGGPTRNAAAQDTIDRIGWRLLESLEQQLESYNRENPGANRKNPYLNAFQFILLADRRTVNAFALPGGKVFVTEALWSRLETEGQKAGVIGHEIGHVIERHGNKRMAKQGLYQGLAGAMGVLGGGGGQGDGMGQMIASALSMKYGREHELESDKWGVRLCVLAGYDPNAMLGVMKILEEATGGQGGPPEFMSTHPKPKNRVAYIKQVIQDEFPEGLPTGLRP